MLWWQNIPFFSILLCLLSAAVCSVLSAKAAARWVSAVLALCTSGGAVLLYRMTRPGAEPFRFMMGHFPAPWGNELRCGALEALMGFLFPLFLGCCLAAGAADLRERSSRASRYLALCMLMSAALLSQVYSNDVFTCYVFLEIMTLTSCALLVYRDTGPALAAGMHYMVMNLVGSGLFLLGVALLYNLTGHLLMEPLGDSVAVLAESGEYHRALTIILALITVGLAVKSDLFPFHSWAPNTYSAALPASSAILAGLTCKGYIFLLLKLYVRVFGWDLILLSGVDRCLLVFALSGMIVGSVAAVQARRLTWMTAWSSVAQISYIFLGIALGAYAGYEAAMFHLVMHMAAKSLLFLAGGRLSRAAGGRDEIADLAGSARLDPVSGVCWTVAACSLVGLPLTGGLVSKMLLGMEALNHSLPVAAASLAVLALSTLLNVLYFLRAALVIWSPRAEGLPSKRLRAPAARCACCVLALFVLLTFTLASPLRDVLSLGLRQF